MILPGRTPARRKRTAIELRGRRPARRLRPGTALRLSAALAALVHVGGARPALTAEDPETAAAIALLRSSDPFERQRGESLLVRAGREALPGIVRELEGPGEGPAKGDPRDEVLRARLDRVFSDTVDALVAEIEREHQLLESERREIAALENRAEAYRLRESIRPKIDAWKQQDPEIEEKLERMLRLAAIEEAAAARPPAPEPAGAGGEAPETGGEVAREPGGAPDPTQVEKLRTLRDELRDVRPDLDEIVRDLRRLSELDTSGLASRPPGELEEMRLEEVRQSAAAREERLATRTRSIDELGLAAWNRVAARGATVRGGIASTHPEIIVDAIARHREALFPADAEQLERSRYSRSALWAFVADRAESEAPRAAEALDRHLSRTVQDLDRSEPAIRERAAVELFTLGRRGADALRARAEAGSEDARFLLHLLTWRIHPGTYLRTGIDFREYPRLGFRDRRQRLFEYARTAGDDALPLLRKVVEDESAEPSLAVRVAAAKAMAGLRDFSGYELLIRTHPDLTLTRPEVSLELGLIQGMRHIRDKEYALAVAELEKVLAESPFEFRAHYQIAFAYLLLKEYDKSIHHFEVAKRIDPHDQLTLYNLACAYALSGRKDDALRELEASVDAGFRDPEHIQSDPDLESLRQDPRYRRLLERLRAGPGPEAAEK